MPFGLLRSSTGNPFAGSCSRRARIEASAANDSRTRATHRAANGQVVRIGEPIAAHERLPAVDAGVVESPVHLVRQALGHHASLVRLGADRLVVDPSVVEAIRGGDVELSRAVGSVTGLGAALGSEVIATGVPSLDVAHTLVELGVGVAQVMVTEPWAPKRPLKRGDSVVVDR